MLARQALPLLFSKSLDFRLIVEPELDRRVRADRIPKGSEMVELLRNREQAKGNIIACTHRLVECVFKSLRKARK